MDAKLKARWITALRSGKYKQGAGQLRHKPVRGGFQYCCLGVLCDVVAPGNWDDYDEWTSIVEWDNGNAVVLPNLFAEQTLGTYRTDESPVVEANMNGVLPFEDRDGNPVGLAGLNDSGQFTFDQIADVIEWAF